MALGTKFTYVKIIETKHQNKCTSKLLLKSSSKPNTTYK